MSLDDRDYMRERRPLRFPEPWPNPLVRWWRRTRLVEILSIGILALSLASAAVWFMRDLDLFGGPSKGSLRVNINTATLEELETVPGIGPALAGLIVAGRPYATIEELERVRGIGPATVDGMRPFVKVEGEAEKLL